MHRTENTPKVIAFYLPQFHRIPENDLWWGDGFTEWTNTRKSKSLFPGHNQPREPLNDYYYDLTDSRAREWQATVAKKHGVYGFCYYHYWFKGRKLLETPFYEVVKTGKPNFPFCLSWANHNWTRKWDGANNHMLIQQAYGNEEDWENHFNYLLPAFLDDRYIKVDGKPFFIIYRAREIPRCGEMIAYWNNLATDNGLNGIFFVETLGSGPTKIDGFHGRILNEPDCNFHNLQDIYLPSSEREYYNQRELQLLSYDLTWERILNRDVAPYLANDKNLFLGAFVDWDNSPRVGSRSPVIFVGGTPQKFGANFYHLMEKATSINSEFIFINAWNEWGEGNYLEPDKKFGYQYLEQLKRALS